jgi:signal transduction histidine kinase/CheY-like chemotaxis protein
VNPVLEKQIAKLKADNQQPISCDERLLELVSSTYDFLEKQEISLKSDYDILLAAYKELQKSIAIDEVLKLTNIKNRYESFCENSADALVCMDRNKFLFCNAAALNLLGINSQDELRSYGLLDLSPQFQPNGSNSKILIDECINKAFSGQINKFDWLCSRINGENFLAEITVKKADFEGEQVLYATLRDVSAQKKIGGKFLIYKEITEDQDRKKYEFLVNFSRDMKASLNSVIGFTDVITESGLNAKQLEALNNLHASSEILLNMVDELCLLAELQADRIIMDCRSNNLQKIIDSVINDCNNFFQGSSVFFEYVSDLHIAFYKFDSNFLKIILINIISNAAKFTIKGAVRFKVLIIEDNLDNSLIRFEVTDTGIGIPAEDKRNIFQPFYQIENRFIDNSHGYGIGLFFVKMLVEMMGGDIHVESEIGRGSRFWFSLRLPKSEEILTVADVVKHDEKFDFSGKRILIVEDNKINQLLAKSFLDKVHASYRIADNGKIALEILQKEDFDLVLMDLHMPVMNGIDAAQHIRKLQDSKKSTLPIVALTASLSENEVSASKAAGINDCLAKPIDAQKLYALLKVWLNK